MKPITMLAVLVAASAPCLADDVPETKSKAEWFADYDKAVLAAKEQKKDLLVDFTGSDWCGWCIKLHKEVFEQPEFESDAPKSYVLVALDYPHGDEAKAKVPNPARNDELQAKYGIDGFPTVLVLSPDGEVIARAGYEKGGAASWLAHLSKSSEKGHAAIAAAAALETEYAAADAADAKSAVVAKAVAALEDAAKNGAPSAKLAALARHALEDAAGAKPEAATRALKAIYASGRATDADAPLAEKLDPKNDVGLAELVLAAKFKSVTGKLHSREDVDAHKKEIEDFLAAARAFAKAGVFKDDQVYVVVLANTCGMAVELAGDRATAKEIATALKEKGPKDNPRLDDYLKSFLADAPPEKK